MSNLNNIIEAILFASGDGLTVDYIAEKIGVSVADANKAIEQIKKQYSGESGVHLIKYGKNYQFCSNSKYATEVAAVLNPVRERNLTRAALETMAIIAYKQPITKLEIEDVRGVDSTYAISVLQSNGLVDIVGRKDSVGKPFVYGTTNAFLKRFELDDIENLPSYEELIDKIKVIQTKEQNNAGASIYDRGIENINPNDKISGLPEFLEGEDLEYIE